MHREAFEFIARSLTDFPSLPSVIEIGGRDINGSVRPLFRAADSYVSIDIQPGRGVDVVADAADYMPAEPVQCVVCCEVLEHAEQAAKIVANAAKMLQPGGVLFVTAATDPRVPHSAVDGGAVQAGEFYRNIDANELTSWLEDVFGQINVTVDAQRGDVYAVAVKPTETPSRNRWGY